MKFQERKITLKDGRSCILRPTTPEYAEEMIEYMKKTPEESDYLLRYPDEVNFTVESEKEILGRLYEDPYSIMMMPVVDGKVAGNGSISGIGNKRKI
ncbi:MAG: GNAT family N-acetyltransferase, partial [Lachnospiraceae bacterium]|nr:GNAT family N-acetyltransferase [Lachnospiraceae bacterium]